MNISICQLCKDPIWSFICPHCLARDISRWLPRKIRGAFSKFNENFFGSFSATIDIDGLRCLRCRKVRLANICPFCYFMEAYDWLRERNLGLARDLLEMIPHNKGIRMDHSRMLLKSSSIPISFTEDAEADEGYCEICERYDERIVNSDGKWVCRDCDGS
jgi:hypothetical protein